MKWDKSKTKWDSFILNISHISFTFSTVHAWSVKIFIIVTQIHWPVGVTTSSDGNTERARPAGGSWWGWEGVGSRAPHMFTAECRRWLVHAEACSTQWLSSQTLKGKSERMHGLTAAFCTEFSHDEVSLTEVTWLVPKICKLEVYDLKTCQYFNVNNYLL